MPGCPCKVGLFLTDVTQYGTWLWTTCQQFSNPRRISALPAPVWKSPQIHYLWSALILCLALSQSLWPKAIETLSVWEVAQPWGCWLDLFPEETETQKQSQKGTIASQEYIPSFSSSACSKRATRYVFKYMHFIVSSVQAYLNKEEMYLSALLEWSVWEDVFMLSFKNDLRSLFPTTGSESRWQINSTHIFTPSHPYPRSASNKSKHCFPLNLDMVSKSCSTFRYPFAN